MTDLIACGYGTPAGCLVCDEYGNASKEPVMIAAMAEPPEGTVVTFTVGSDPYLEEVEFDNPPEPVMEQVVFVASTDENPETRWWNPLDWGATSWGVILHEAAPAAPAIVTDELTEALAVDAAIYKQRYSTLSCETCLRVLGPSKRTFPRA